MRLTVGPHTPHLPFDHPSSPGHPGNHLDRRIRLPRRLDHVGGVPLDAPRHSCCCRSRHFPLRRIGFAQRIGARTAHRRIDLTEPKLAWRFPLPGVEPIRVVVK